MKEYRRALLWALFCIAASAHADDEIKPTRNDQSFTVELRVMKPADAVAECKRLNAWGDATVPRNYVGGCNVVYIDRTPKHCILIVPSPRFVDDEATTVWGHELTHCAFGRYHQP